MNVNLSIRQFVLLITIGLFLLLKTPSLAQDTPPIDSIDHVLFLIGDAGSPEQKTAPVFDFLLDQVKTVESKSSLIFLGDNVYPSGIPNQNEDDRKNAEDILLYQLHRLKDSKAKTYYIPGNHDWNDGKENGVVHLKNQEKLIEEVLENDNSFIPNNGCPGPVKVDITDQLVLIAIDTQWWIHQYKKGNCENTTTVDIAQRLKDILTENKGKNIIVIGHHPIISYGKHGGYFSWKDHIFPLTNVNPYLFIPLPLIGSLYPLYKKKSNNIQDLSHPEYQEMVQQLKKVFKEHKNLIYAAGHEHNLQYLSIDSQHFIVSGSGSKTSPVKKLKAPYFSAKQKGFFKVYYLKNGHSILEAYGIIKDEQKLMFKKKLF